MNERLDVVGTHFNLRAEQIGEQVALDVRLGTGWEVRCGGKEKVTCGTSVSLEVRLDSKILVEVEDEAASAAIQAMSPASGYVRSKSGVRVVQAHLRFREFLCPRCNAEQKTNCEDDPFLLL